MNKFDQLKKMTTIVADSGEIEEIKKFHPTDSTTNPSLIFSAAGKPEYQYLIKDAITFAKGKAKGSQDLIELVIDKLFVNFGLEILKYIPGRISTEVDARLSFDVEGSIHKAQRLISFYEAAGIDRSRVLIKLASTWEGVLAAEQLEKHGIHCNMTLLFSLPQAIACAEAKATLISPFVGRILDWYKKAEGKDYQGAEDPGVISVTQIYHYYKKHGYKTQVMGASFRNLGEILELAGCDLLTIAPKLLEELKNLEGPVERKLNPEKSHSMNIAKRHMDEKTFRWELNENAMATEKLSEGIRNFTKDLLKLEEMIKKML